MKKQNEDFAIIHNIPKGQVLITREPEDEHEIITIWVRLEDIGMAKFKMTIKDEDLADRAFEKYKDYEVIKPRIFIKIKEMTTFMILLLAHAVYILKLFDIFRKESTLLIALIGFLLSAVCWRQDIMWGIVTLTYTSFISILLITLYYDDIDDL